MNNKLFFNVLNEAFTFVASKRDELCHLDTKIGDGDHGVTVERGFGAAAALCDDFKGSVAELFEAVSDVMATAMGGAIGPVYGAFWLGAAQSCKAEKPFNGEALANAFSSGCTSVMALGKVSPGDKTVVDAMFPCQEAMLKEKHNEFLLVLEAGALAARKGAEATKDMIAKRGRARFMGEKSKGYIDAGAVSFAMLTEAMAYAFKHAQEVN